MFDVIVVGGGHAGTEAAAAAARRGASTLLLALDHTRIGAMSCNPAFGGLGKGHIVREIDALDGVMAMAADAAAIHHRMLNRSKGAAVQGPRVQADRRRYLAAVQAMIAATPGLTVADGEVVDLVVAQDRVAGVILADGTRIAGRSVVLATGTFLGGRLFRGTERFEGGRISERGAARLGARLRDLGLPIARLKTGTPPRLDGRTIDWARLDSQPSDGEHWTLSSRTERRLLPQIACGVTRTTAQTHAIIREGLDRSPLFSGAIGGAGPRYCPSIEDKVHRFGDRDGHQIFLEPEGLDDPIVYPNGISTSLPTDVQQRMIASIAGLERAVVVEPGYAVEYDYVDPRALDHDLGLRAIAGVFCAGQLNGTTGYEEAGGQGLVAGANAAAHALGRAPLLLDRASSYIGVMIDDLVLQGVTEPYRMLTARAEFRLSLRADNAEVRLGAIAEDAGLLTAERMRHNADRQATRAALREEMDATFTAHDLDTRGLEVSQDGARRTVFDWLRFPHVDVRALLRDVDGRYSGWVIDALVEDARYAPYIARQAEEIAALRRDENLALPGMLNFSAIAGLSTEMVERLAAARPATLGAASRIRGVTPAALAAVLLHVRRKAA